MDFGSVFAVLTYIDVTTVSIGVVVFFVVAYFIAMKEPSGIPPGPTFLPIIGNIHNMTSEIYAGKRHRYFEDIRRKYGDIFRIYFADQLVIFLNDYSSIEEAFVKQSCTFNYRPTAKLWGVEQSVRAGGGIAWADGQEWKDCRRIALQTLRDLGMGKSTLEDRIQEETRVMIDILAESEGKSIRIRKILMAATTNIISIVVFGKCYDYDDPNFTNIIHVIDSALKSDGPFSPIHRFPSLRFIPFLAKKLMYLRNLVIQVEHFITDCIEEHKKTFTKGCLNDFIDCYLDSCHSDSKSPISEGCMRKAILDLFVAGSDTTATTIDWAFLFMILYEDVQRKCQEEIDRVVGSGRMVKWSDRHNMPYIEATLQEAQRFGNSVPFSLPHYTTKDAWVKGYLIPKGSHVYANMSACHLDPDYWEEPLKFRPERFIDPNGKVKKQLPAFLPFSTGPRICPGESLAKMEMFLFFTGLLQRFNLSPLEGTIPSTDGHFGMILSTSPYDIVVKSRLS